MGLRPKQNSTATVVLLLCLLGVAVVRDARAQPPAHAPSAIVHQVHIASERSPTTIKEEHTFQQAQNSTVNQTDSVVPATNVPVQESDILIVYSINKQNASPLRTLAPGSQPEPKAKNSGAPEAQTTEDKTTQRTSVEQEAHSERTKVGDEERMLEHGPFEEETIENPPIHDEFDPNGDFETDAQLEEDRSEFNAQNDRAEEELEDEQREMAEVHQTEETDHILDYDYATDHGNHSETENSDYDDAAFEKEVERLYDQSEALADLETDIQEDIAHDTLQREDSSTTVPSATENGAVAPTTSEPHTVRGGGNSKISEAKRTQLAKLAKERRKMKMYPKNINEKIHAVDDDKISSKKPEKTNFVSKSQKLDQPRKIISGQNLKHNAPRDRNRSPTPPPSNQSHTDRPRTNSAVQNPALNGRSNTTRVSNTSNNVNPSALASLLGRAPRPRNNGLNRTNGRIIAGLPGQRRTQEGHSLEHPTVMMSLLSGSYLKCPVCSKQDPRGHCRPVFWCGMWPLAHKTKP